MKFFMAQDELEQSGGERLSSSKSALSHILSEEKGHAGNPQSITTEMERGDRRKTGQDHIAPTQKKKVKL